MVLHLKVWESRSLPGLLSISDPGIARAMPTLKPIKLSQSSRSSYKPSRHGYHAMRTISIGKSHNNPVRATGIITYTQGHAGCAKTLNMVSGHVEIFINATWHCCAIPWSLLRLWPLAKLGYKHNAPWQTFGLPRSLSRLWSATITWRGMEQPGSSSGS